MPRVMCEFCRERVPQRQYKLHLKRCVKARRALKKQIGFTKIADTSELVPQDELIEQPIEPPIEPVENTETLENNIPPEENVEEIIEEVTEEITPEVTEPEPVENTGKLKKKKK